MKICYRVSLKEVWDTVFLELDLKVRRSQPLLPPALWKCNSKTLVYLFNEFKLSTHLVNYQRMPTGGRLV